MAVNYRIDIRVEMARVLHTEWALGLQGGVVIANPVLEQYAMPEALIDHAINQALAAAVAWELVALSGR